MSHPIVTTVTIGTADADGIATAQAVGAGVSAVINGALASGGVATMDAPRRVIVTSSGNDTGITFTITGTRGEWWGDQTLVETIDGANAGASATTQDFLTVTSVVPSGATAGTVTVGTNETASGPWVVWSTFPSIFDIGIVGYVMDGSPTYSLEYTYDDVFGTWLPADVPFPRPIVYTGMQNETTNSDASLNSIVRATRLTLTAVGSVQLSQQQMGT